MPAQLGDDESFSAFPTGGRDGRGGERAGVLEMGGAAADGVE